MRKIEPQRARLNHSEQGSPEEISTGCPETTTTRDVQTIALASREQSPSGLGSASRQTAASDPCPHAAHCGPGSRQGPGCQLLHAQP